ncbi:MAG TPA: hypothetical protein DCW95_02290 [Chryseobacterium sp.]|nr:hypothetical protein [Chryseobacterium sp.]
MKQFLFEVASENFQLKKADKINPLYFLYFHHHYLFAHKTPSIVHLSKFKFDFSIRLNILFLRNLKNHEKNFQ